MSEFASNPLAAGAAIAPENLAEVLTDALRLRRAMEIDTVGVLLFTPEGGIVQANDAFLRMGGWTREDLDTGRLRWTDLTPPEWKEASANALAEFLTTGNVRAYEKQYFRKDGSRFWVFIASRRLSPEEGIAFVLDITSRKDAEEGRREALALLERSESQLKTITDSLPALIAYVDADLRYVRVNRAYARYFNTAPEAIIGRHMSQVLGSTFPAVEPHIRRALAGEPQLFELTLSAALGVRHMLAEHIPDLAPDGEVRGVVIQSHDVTERRQAENMLRTAEKLSAVGRLAASMAHEINNPLEAVTNLIFLARQSPSQETTQLYLEQAEAELRRVSSITNQTLRFHKQSTRPQPVWAADLFASALSVYEQRLRNGGVEVLQRVRCDDPVVCFDGEIRQVLSNLLSNALDAMAGRPSKLILRACCGTDWHTGRTGLRFTIADTGVGIPQGMCERVWEPFFTTKDIGGTGLGLWISRDIAERHAGTLRLRSREGVGTVLCLWLPLETVVR